MRRIVYESSVGIPIERTIQNHQRKHSQFAVSPVEEIEPPTEDVSRWDDTTPAMVCRRTLELVGESERYAKIIRMRIVEGKTIEETAKLCKVKKLTVMRVMARLRD